MNIMNATACYSKNFCFIHKKDNQKLHIMCHIPICRQMQKYEKNEAIEKRLRVRL